MCRYSPFDAQDVNECRNRKASAEQKRTVSGERALVPWEGGTPGKTENSEYEKPRTVCDANARGLIRSVNFWVAKNPHSKVKDKALFKRIKRRESSRGTAFPARLDNAPCRNRAFGKAHFARPRAVSERLSCRRGSIEGEPFRRLYENTACKRFACKRY